MAQSNGEGKIYIGMEEFMDFLYSKSVLQEYMENGWEVVIGVPTLNRENQEIEVSYAYSSENSPADWADTPKALKEWKGLDDE